MMFIDKFSWICWICWICTIWLWLTLSWKITIYSGIFPWTMVDLSIDFCMFTRG
jgi:hypothetical protein